jgi:hypothetical protein
MSNEMDDYKSNSYKDKKECSAEPRPITNDISETKVSRLAPKEPVKVRKRSGLSRSFDEFVRDDLNKVKEFAITDVIVPAIKKSISDIFKTGIDMILYHGETGSSSRRYPDSSKVSYRSYYDSAPARRTSYSDRRNAYYCDERIFDSRGEAEAKLAQLDDIMARYHLVRVADYCEIVGITGNYTDNDYGWTDLRTAEVVRVREGYIIRMPRALPID